MISSSMEALEDYMHDWHAKHTFDATYRHIMYPLNGPDMWEKSGKPPIEPPKYLKKIGRPKKARREPDELPDAETGKLRRYLKRLNCRKCGHVGHNVRTCKARHNEGASGGTPPMASQTSFSLKPTTVRPLSVGPPSMRPSGVWPPSLRPTTVRPPPFRPPPPTL